MNAKTPIKSQTWNLSFTAPTTDPGWGKTKNHYEGVIAATAEEAIATIRLIYPEAVIDQLRKGSAIHHFAPSA